MRRLIHSSSGHIRSMQISNTQLFIFVEGKQSDPYFFAKVCKASLPDSIEFEILTAQQISGGAGGKEALISYFRCLRQRSALISSFEGKKTACIFILDKDIDDIKRKQLRSTHVIYTQHYDVQNYIFEHGDLVTGVAAAASIDPRKLHGVLGNSSEWCRRVSHLWRDWIALCFRLIEDGIRGEANYGAPSRIQTRNCGMTDTLAHESLVRTLAQRTNISFDEMMRKVELSKKKIDRYFKKGQHHRIFKGKWFSLILADEVERIMTGQPHDCNGLAGRLPSTIAATLNFNGHWIEYFKHRLCDVAAML